MSHYILLFISLSLPLLSNGEGEAGTIYDYFTDESSVFASAEYEQLKSKIDPGDVEYLFRKVEKKLKKQIDLLAQKGNEVIPVISFDRIKNNGGRLPEGIVDKVKKKGVLVVRNTIPKDEIEEMMADLITYLYDNQQYPPKDNKVIKVKYLNSYGDYKMIN